MITQILIARPPIWDEAHRNFTIDDTGTIYTYGEVLYNPANVTISPDLMIHEHTHSRQQLELQGGPAMWWKNYFADTKFRRDQEIEAYQGQFAAYCKDKKDRNQQTRYLHQLVRLATSDMYKLELNFLDALHLIGRK